MSTRYVWGRFGIEISYEKIVQNSAVTGKSGEFGYCPSNYSINQNDGLFELNNPTRFQLTAGVRANPYVIIESESGKTMFWSKGINNGSWMFVN